MDALEETGIDEDDQGLGAFWVEPFATEGDSDGEDEDEINQNLLGKVIEEHHKEVIRGCWEVKPLPVLVLSKSMKVRFGKGLT